MANRRLVLSLVIWLSAAALAHAQSMAIPNPSEYLGDRQYNAFGRRPTLSELTFNAFAKQPPYDQSLHGAIEGGLRDAAFLGPRLVLDFDYLMWFIQPDNVPPLLTTGSLVDPVPGALGQPNTIILYGGNIDYGPLNGGRVRATWVIVDQFEVMSSFYFSEQRGELVDAVSDANGNPLLARPFFNPVAGVQDADPRSLTNVFQGATHTEMTSQFMGADALMRWSEPKRSDGPSWSLFGGFNFLRLDERIYMRDTSLALPLGTASDFRFTDEFSTSNRLYGGQVGAQMDWCFPDGVVTIFGKVTVGGVQQQLRIAGATTVTTAGVSQTDFDQGLYAQPTNVGQYEQWRAGVVPEFGLNVGYCLHERVRISAGYTFMYLTNVLRPGEQIDTTVNIQPLFSPVVLPPLRPAVPLESTNLWLQNLNFGIGFIF